MSTKHSKTIVLTVSTIQERRELVKRIYTNLTKEPSVDFAVMQDQVNRIKIFHRGEKGAKILIRTYVVVVIPIIIDLKQLNNYYGSVDFKLDATINRLQGLITKLKAKQGQKFIKMNQNKSLEAALTSMIGDY